MTNQKNPLYLNHRKLSMKVREIKNGSLYFNLDKNRVERVRGKLNSSSVMTSEPHEDDLIATKAENLRIASDKEVENYKEESLKI